MTRPPASSSPIASSAIRFILVSAFLSVASAAAADVPATGALPRDPCAGPAARYVVTPAAATLFALGTCHEQQGKTASAWAELLEAQGMALHDKHPDVALAAQAKQHANALEARLSTLAVRVAPGWDIPGLDVRRDGIALVRAAWGTPAPVDPGEHHVEVTAPGKRPWKRTIVVRPGSLAVSIDVGPLDDDAPALAAKPAVGSATLTSAGIDADAPPDVTRPGSTQRTVGLVLAGLGLASAGVGTYFGLRTLHQSDAARGACPSSPCSDRAAVDENERAKTSATVSTVTLASGGGLFLLGTILFFAAPRASTSVAVMPSVTPSFAGVNVGGAL